VPGTSEVATNALLRFLDLNSERVADWDSLAFGWQYVTSAFSPEPFGAIHVAAVLAALALAGVGVFAVRHRRRATVATVAAGLVLLVVVVGLGTPRLAAWTAERATIPVPALNLVTGLAFVAALAGIAVLVLSAPRRPRLASVVFLTVAAFLLTNKVFSPQYVLWMLPLVALALPRRRPFLLWQVTEALVLVTRYYYFAGVNDRDVPSVGLGWFVAAVVLRDAALVGLAVLVVRDVRHPEGDPVRLAAGGEDPVGGVLSGAADRMVLRRRPSTPDRPAEVGRVSRGPGGATTPAGVVGDPGPEEHAADVRA
jgi:hypothetical protein